MLTDSCEKVISLQQEILQLFSLCGRDFLHCKETYEETFWHVRFPLPKDLQT